MKARFVPVSEILACEISWIFPLFNVVDSLHK